MIYLANFDFQNVITGDFVNTWHFLNQLGDEVVPVITSEFSGKDYLDTGFMESTKLAMPKGSSEPEMLQLIDKINSKDDTLVIVNEHAKYLTGKVVYWRTLIYHLIDQFKGQVWIANFDVDFEILDAKHFIQVNSPLLDYECYENKKTLNVITSVWNDDWQDRIIHVDHLGRIIKSDIINSMLGKRLVENKLIQNDYNIQDREFDFAYPATITENANRENRGTNPFKFELLKRLQDRYSVNVISGQTAKGLQNELDKTKFSFYFQDDITPFPTMRRLRWWEQSASSSLQLFVDIWNKSIEEVMDDIDEQYQYFSNPDKYRIALRGQHNALRKDYDDDKITNELIKMDLI